MRLLVLSNLYPPYAVGGYEQACLDVVEGLRERGHRVEVMTSRYGLTRPLSERGIHRVLRLDPFWAPDDTVWGSKDCAEKRRRPRPAVRSFVRWSRAAEALARTCYRSMDASRSMRAMLRTLRPEVLYLWNMRALPSSLLTVAQRSGIPMVINLQDYWLLEKARGDRWLALWERETPSDGQRIARNVLRSVVDPLLPTRLPRLTEASAHHVSHAFAAFYSDKGWRFARERVIYNSLDLRMYPRREQSPPRKPCKLLFLGRLSPEKGAHVAISATAILADQLGKDAVRLTIAGATTDPTYVQYLRRLARDLDLDDLVVFRGAVAHDLTAALYAEHDVFLFPSNWHESFGLVLAEALACGLAVVGTTPGGSAEILEDEVTGLVVPAEDATALARQVRRLIEDPALARRLAGAGAEMVRQRFDRQRIIAQVEDYLRDVVREGR